MSEQATPEDDAATTSGHPATDGDTEGHYARADEQPGYARTDDQPSVMVQQHDEDDTEGHAKV
jgi:hypothetical protein